MSSAHKLQLYNCFNFDKAQFNLDYLCCKVWWVIQRKIRKGVHN